MRKVELNQRFSHGHFSIWKYDNLQLDSLIKEIEFIISNELEDVRCVYSRMRGDSELGLVEKALPEIFPDFSDDDIELALEKMYEEIEGIEGSHVNRYFNDVVSTDKQVLLYWYRQREALFVNWKHIQEIS